MQQLKVRNCQHGYKNEDKLLCHIQEIHFKNKDPDWLKVKRWDREMYAKLTKVKNKLK